MFVDVLTNRFYIALNKCTLQQKIWHFIRMLALLIGMIEVIGKHILFDCCMEATPFENVHAIKLAAIMIRFLILIASKYWLEDIQQYQTNEESALLNHQSMCRSNLEVCDKLSLQ